MSYLWDLFAQRQLREVQREGIDNRLRTQEADYARRSLADRYEQLCLLCEAMWELLRDTAGASDAMLLAKIEEIDLRDGKLDGKRSHLKKCEQCHRTINPSRAKCIFCGTPLATESAFEKV